MDSSCKDSANSTSLNDGSVFDALGERGSETEINDLYSSQNYDKTKIWGPPIELQTPYTDGLVVSRDAGRFVCDTCHKRVDKLSYLAIHQRFHTTQKYFKCPECYDFLYTLNDLSMHCQKHTVDLIECPACNGSFEDLAVFKQHLGVHRIELEDSVDDVQVSDEDMNVEREVLYNNIHYLNEMILVRSLGATQNSYVQSFTCKHCCLTCTSKFRLCIHNMSHKHSISGQIRNPTIH